MIKKSEKPKLGDAPVGHQQLIRSPLVKLYSVTSYVLCLERPCAFIFVLLF